MSGWWFGTWILCSISYGMSSFPLTNAHIFQDGWNHQPDVDLTFKNKKWCSSLKRIWKYLKHMRLFAQKSWSGTCPNRQYPSNFSKHGQEICTYSVYLQTNAALANFDPVIEGQRSFTSITPQENIETSWVWKETLGSFNPVGLISFMQWPMGLGGLDCWWPTRNAGCAGPRLCARGDFWWSTGLRPGFFPLQRRCANNKNHPDWGKTEPGWCFVSDFFGNHSLVTYLPVKMRWDLNMYIYI